MLGKKIVCLLGLCVSTVQASTWNEEGLGYSTSLTKNTAYISLNTGLSVYSAPKNTSVASQIPVALNFNIGQRFQTTSRVFLGYEFGLGHLGSEIINTNQTVHQFFIQGLGTSAIFLNPYLDINFKAGLAYKKTSDQRIHRE
jgi:hypothetical protein